MPMYQLWLTWDASRPRSCREPARRRSRSQCPTWSRQGPDMLVNDAKRCSSRSSQTTSHDWIEPQSCATRCTFWWGATASSTASMSRTSRGRA